MIRPHERLFFNGQLLLGVARNMSRDFFGYLSRGRELEKGKIRSFQLFHLPQDDSEPILPFLMMPFFEKVPVLAVVDDVCPYLLKLFPVFQLFEWRKGCRWSVSENWSSFFVVLWIIGIPILVLCCQLVSHQGLSFGKHLSRRTQEKLHYTNGRSWSESYKFGIDTVLVVSSEVVQCSCVNNLNIHCS